MRFSPSINAGPRSPAFFAFILFFAGAACSAGRAEMDKTGAESDSVKSKKSLIWSILCPDFGGEPYVEKTIDSSE